MANEINQVKVGSTTYTLQDARVDSLPADYVKIDISGNSGTLTSAQLTALKANPHKTVLNWSGFYCFAENLSSAGTYYYSANCTFNGTTSIDKKVITLNTSSGAWSYSNYTYSNTTPNNGTLTIQKNGTSVGTFTANQSGSTTANITVPTTASDVGAAPKTAGVYLVKGNTTGTEGTWTGTSSDFTDYYDGLVVAYDIGIAGATTTTLNINDNGAKTVYLRGTTKLTTHYAVGTIILLVYSADADCWFKADYDANTNTQVRVYRQDASGYNKDYPLIASRTVASSVGTAGTESSYSAVYGLISDTAANIPTTNPYSGEVKVKKLTVSGDISAGNLATVATSGAYSDLSGTPTFSFSNGVLTITT